jgi:diadenosine tetraphosphatase ApaH/serine/threonine PP2A family protein phosphatase
MRYGLISDIHSNLEASRAVLEALAKDNVDEYLLIGDVIGYGADPKACITLTRSLNPAVQIAGNHEWGVVGLLDLEYFNELAAAAIEWTRERLDKDETDYLRSFKLIHEDKEKGFTLVHGSPAEPGKFYYILNGDDAGFAARHLETALCFVGHSHVPGVFRSDSGDISRVSGHSIKMDRGKRYIVNVGSIGQPRDGDARASYAIYDDEAKTVEIRRVEYDIETAQRKILEAGLPAKLAYRLSWGR